MKETFIIIGEGPTEYFFLTSLKDEFRTLQNIDPQYPKHTSMAELELKIKKAIEQGYNHVYCMIDLDNKEEGKNKSDYVNLKKKYHGKHISKPKKDRRKGDSETTIRPANSIAKYRRCNIQCQSTVIN